MFSNNDNLKKICEYDPVNLEYTVRMLDLSATPIAMAWFIGHDTDSSKRMYNAYVRKTNKKWSKFFPVRIRKTCRIANI